jgi:hypothetical protein
MPFSSACTAAKSALHQQQIGKKNIKNKLILKRIHATVITPYAFVSDHTSLLNSTGYTTL